MVQASKLMKKGILIIIIIMIFYVSLAIYSDANALIKHFTKIKVLLIFPILACFTSTLFIQSIRQFFFLKQIDIHIPFKENIIIYFTGLSLLITPGGVGSIIKSHFLLKNHNKPISKTVPMVLAERYYDALVMFSITMLFAFVANVAILKIPFLAVGIFLLALTIVAKNKRLFLFAQLKMTKFRFLKKFENSLLDFNSSLHTFFNKKSILYGLVFTITAWFLDSIGIFLCFKAFGLNFDFILTSIFGFSSILFGAVSFIPSGAGVTEFTFIKLLSSYGVDFSLAAALVIFFRLVNTWFITCLGFVATKFALK